MFLLFILITIFTPVLQEPAPNGFYVVAMKIEDNRPDLSAEKKVREELTKQKQSLATAASKAEMVFVVFTEYATYSAVTGVGGNLAGVTQVYLKSAKGLVLPAAHWVEAKGDLEKLKEKALWQSDVAAAGLREASLSKLVKMYTQKK